MAGTVVGAAVFVAALAVPLGDPALLPAAAGDGVAGRAAGSRHGGSNSGTRPRHPGRQQNFFMNVPVLADGTMGIVDGPSKPGDYIELGAESRVLAVVSNCRQSGRHRTRLRASS